MKCKICGKELTLNSMKCHVKRQHNITYGQYKEKFNESTIKCLYCNKILNNVHPNKKFCNETCKLNYSKEKKYSNIKNIPICKICGMKGLNLTTHLNKLHNISVSDYMKKYNLTKYDVYHQSYLDTIGTSGTENPAYNHGGKYSPFSKKFIYYNGEEKRIEIIKKASKNRTYTSKREYYLEDTQCNYDLADFLLSKRQSTFSKKKCIKKYGKEKGLKVWAERQEKWLNNFPCMNYSMISQKLFWILYQKTKKLYIDIYFAQLNENKKLDESGKNHEYKLNVGISYIKPDFFIKDIGKIIEFDGDYWHGKSKGNKERENQRDKIIENNGYDVLHVKERDYNNNSEAVIKNCLEFINEQKI